MMPGLVARAAGYLGATGAYAMSPSFQKEYGFLSDRAKSATVVLMTKHTLLAKLAMQRQ